ncbi:MAG: hypothetical protein ACI4IQ_05590 [Eubacterium sp.]
MKFKIFAIMMCAVIALGVGTAVAYYNTKSFGFDENTKIISKDDEKFSFMDFEFYYNDVNDFFNKAKQYIPTEVRKI